MEINASDLFIEKFDDVFLDIMNHGHVHYTFPGGRGGTKSSFIGMMVPLLLINHPSANALCFRRYSNTLKESVYAEIMAGIFRLGLESDFASKVSPLEIIYKPTGQRILFRGLDEPEKIKSIKMQRGYIAVTWIEELSQAPGRAELRNVLQSTQRGGRDFWHFESFNPPITRSAWVNEDLSVDDPARLITWSNYLDVPVDWLGKAFFDRAEHLRITDERAYRHEYLGEAIGTGGNVFDRLEVRTIPDDWIRRFDRIYQGIDFGWYPDPAAFVRLAYDAARQAIYILDEIYANKMSNEDLANRIKHKGYADIQNICDSAAPKDIFDLSHFGLKAMGAEKWSGSPEYGMRWLQRRNIIVDPKRTPATAKELISYEYERDRNGELIDGYPDKNNHAIDAIRYALNRVMASTRRTA